MKMTAEVTVGVARIDDDSLKTRIFTVRGVQEILSSDLAALYDEKVKYLHRQVKRNANRFLADFVLNSRTKHKSLVKQEKVKNYKK